MLMEHLTEGTKSHLKLATFVFFHRLRCVNNWEVMKVQKDTVHKLVGQKKLKVEYKECNMLPKYNKANMARMMEAIEEYLRSCHVSR